MKASFAQRDFQGDVVFETKGLAKRFGEKELFSDVNLLVQGGERIALLGDNGAGKTTLIRCLLDQEPLRPGKSSLVLPFEWDTCPKLCTSLTRSGVCTTPCSTRKT